MIISKKKRRIETKPRQRKEGKQYVKVQWQVGSGYRAAVTCNCQTRFSFFLFLSYTSLSQTPLSPISVHFSSSSSQFSQFYQSPLRSVQFNVLQFSIRFCLLVVDSNYYLFSFVVIIVIILKFPSLLFDFVRFSFGLCVCVDCLVVALLVKVNL